MSALPGSGLVAWRKKHVYRSTKEGERPHQLITQRGGSSLLPSPRPSPLPAPMGGIVLSLQVWQVFCDAGWYLSLDHGLWCQDFQQQMGLTDQ